MPVVISRGGEIGRRAGFKIQFSSESVGSSPTLGTSEIFLLLLGSTIIDNLAFHFLGHACALSLIQLTLTEYCS